MGDLPSHDLPCWPCFTIKNFVLRRQWRPHFWVRVVRCASHAVAHTFFSCAVARLWKYFLLLLITNLLKITVCAQAVSENEHKRVRVKHVASALQLKMSGNLVGNYCRTVLIQPLGCLVVVVFWETTISTCTDDRPRKHFTLRKPQTSTILTVVNNVNHSGTSIQIKNYFCVNELLSFAG